MLVLTHATHGYGSEPAEGVTITSTFSSGPGSVRDAIERAKSSRREAIIEALAHSTWDKHFMPYGPTKFVNGQNTGARPLVMQVLKGDISVVLPKEYRQADPVFPWKA